MKCPFCNTTNSKKFGKFGRKKIQRYRCNQCGKTFSEPQQKPLDEMRVSLEKAIQALTLLVEGCGIRVAQRVTGLHQETVLALLEKAGERAVRLLDSKLRNLKPMHVEIDEVWSFVHCK